ncbi:MAG: AAA-ATPase-like protein [Candidatus Magnetoglobus multicellularis str. Araruama]|uniref:AAA-ATPase-like protein n=1 Tax=Candidatus Magnetoglobus multicellularis str. Araruama TaxID=890399 RepID=A0A1V1NVZ0_9BACT|nr:MAG: AAA-ATPase-like protein [Candidatus Magnetoglobus multicellularis str. Araruama]
MKPIPYGNANFYSIREKNHLYIDRTQFIRTLEEMSIDRALFIRPRRFGKSLWLNIMTHYFDINKKDQFAHLFGDLDIGKNPTLDHNQYVVMNWNFSLMSSRGSIDELDTELNETLNAVIEEHVSYYANILQDKIKFYTKAINTLSSFLSAVRKASLKSYLLIDEYDNFANEVMMSDANVYHKLVQKDGPLKTLYKGIKAFLERGLLTRLFITGVSPVVMSDITSGMNICDNIYLDKDFNTICGFTEAEIQNLVNQAIQHCRLDISQSASLIEMMKTWYNGYMFSPESNDRIYNPTLVFYFLKHLIRYCKPPRKMLDSNLAMDEGKLEYIGNEISGKQAIIDVLQTNTPIQIPDIEDRFTLSAMLDQSAQDHTFMASYLYYFGMLTIAGQTQNRHILLEPPNLVIKNLYANQVLRFLLPIGADRSLSSEQVMHFFNHHDLAPLIQFIIEKLFPVFSNRDYRWMNEFALKAVFTTLLFDDINYALFSEPELSRGFADLCLILRPDARNTALFDLLFEFKYVSRSKISEKDIDALSDTALKSKNTSKKGIY